MIQCDEVFEILPRGPFPTGAASDSLVEAHLVRCADCRRLAEALRPAMVAAPEAVAPEEGVNLPCYGGVVGGRRLEPPTPGRPLAGPRAACAPRAAGCLSLSTVGTPLLQFMAAAAVGSVLAVGWMRWDGRLPSSVAPPAGPSGKSAPASVIPAYAVLQSADGTAAGEASGLRSQPGRHSWEAHMSLACYVGGEQAGPLALVPAAGGAVRDAGAYQCCTHCHAACSPSSVGRGTAQVAAACRACH